MSVTNILYFPHPARGGGIERNFALWYAHGRKRHKISVASKTKPAFCGGEDYLSSNMFDLWAHLRRRAGPGDTRLFVFRGVLKPLLLKWLCAITTRNSVKLYFRASNDPSHWWYERSLKRAASELVKLALLRFYDGIIFNSEELRHRCRFYGGKRFLVRNPIAMNRQINYRSDADKTFLYVGRAARQKNLGNLLAAFERLGPAYKLHLIGVPDGADLPENVSTMPWQAEINYAAYRYFIMPSFYEGAPNALLEAVNAGLIAVMTPFAAGGREILKSFEAPGKVAAGFSAKHIADAVQAIAAEQVKATSATPPAYGLEVFAQGLDRFFGSGEVLRD